MEPVAMSFGDHEVELAMPEGGGTYPLVVVFAHEEQTLGALQNALGMDVVLCFVTVAHWFDAMTPWPEESLFRSQPDFGGEADRFLMVLDQILDAVDGALSERAIQVEARHAVGFSLSGIFALYMASVREGWRSVIAISPSAWYAGIVRYFKGREMPESLYQVYLNLGSEEADHSNARIASVDDRVDALGEIFEAQGLRVAVTEAPGDHFDDVHERMAEGIRWSLEGA